ncbi:MAG: YHS domain-containing protein [Weeksellaceae bacterium]|jgi:YHS domain-containing protein|nr:YHS domain-containing protein [Weeksellaceae bacterium]
MKSTFIIAAFIMTAFLISCGGNENKTLTHDDHQMMDVAEALDVEVDNKIDPICEMEMKAGMVKDTIHYNESIYGFCSKSCKETFAKAPEDYLDKM